MCVRYVLWEGEPSDVDNSFIISAYTLQCLYDLTINKILTKLIISGATPFCNYYMNCDKNGNNCRWQRLSRLTFIHVINDDVISCDG